MNIFPVSSDSVLSNILMLFHITPGMTQRFWFGGVFLTIFFVIVNIFIPKKKIEPQRYQTYIQVNTANISNDNSSDKSFLKTLGLWW